MSLYERMSRAKVTDIVLNSLVPAITENWSTAAQAARDGTQTMLTQGAGLITKAGEISRNPQAFGFAFEHLQAIGFNIQAALKDSEARAYQIPADGSTQGSPDIYVDLTGTVIAEIQAKAGSVDYVQQQVRSGKYPGAILTTAENAGTPGTVDRIQVNGIESIPVTQSFAEWVAANPYLAANVIHAAATAGEVVVAGVETAVIQTEIEVLLQAIKAIGAYCRGEQDLSREEATRIIQIAIDSLKSGFVRGAAIKILQRLSGSNALASLGFTVCSTAAPLVIAVLQEELTIEAALAQVGQKALTSAVITPVVLLFPPIGTALISAKVLHAIWIEISPEWKQPLEQAFAGAIAPGDRGVSRNALTISQSPV